MRILFATSECHPFIKTGGLGDVAYALPKELTKLGHDVRVILPKYQEIKQEYKEKMTHVSDWYMNLAWRTPFVGVEELKHDGITYYFVDNMQYFDRPGPYGYDDDAERFAFFSEAVIQAMERINFIPDILHVNDWHTAIIPLLLKVKYNWINSFRQIRVILTIHNIKFQGIFGKEVLGNVLGLGDSLFTDEGLEFHGAINYMKGGINYADYITTVSPTYANEIKFSYFGENLEGLMKRIEYKLVGIVNGIDYDVNNPETDKALPYNYNCLNLEKKKQNKRALQKELSLPERDVPLIGMVSRLTEQKGLDIIDYALNELLQKDIQIIIQGTGDKKYEDSLKYFHNLYNNNFRAEIKFDPQLAQRIYGSCDLFLMPSRFEPCGLSQMIAMRYGTIPIVRNTGGLADTVDAYNKYENVGVGFVFNNFNAHELIGAVDRAIEAFYDRDRWNDIVIRAMELDYSWEKSAKEYESIYKSAMNLNNL